MGEKEVPTNTLDSICSTKAIVSLTGVKVKAGGGAARWQTRGAGQQDGRQGGWGSKMADGGVGQQDGRQGGGAARWQTRGGSKMADKGGQQGGRQGGWGSKMADGGEAARWQTSLVHAPTPLSHMHTVVQHTL